ncbi:MAG TPA: aminotransferase class III-fold pyridoxal phosphate-dependent enzyme, partial [Thermoplasmata archaeon]|nr:aminotransferase class III-fold pyridoxal phosphate-dependent enzyme [Thermoplasmata archaeon]
LGAFHGRTQGALSLTASEAKQRAGFIPTMPGVVHVPYAYCYRCPYKLTYPSCDLYCANIIEDVYMKTVAPPEDLAGVFVEPVQGEGGYIVPPPGWMDRIAKIAKDHGVLLIDDEVQSGLGRTGKMWAIEHSEAVPDILTMAKSLGGGLPIGAAVYPAEMDFQESGKHSNTFGGNPVACAASLATLDVIEEEGLVARSAKIGEHLAKRLDEMAERYEFIGDRRGLGMMQATEFVTDKRSKKPDPKRRDAIEKDAYQHGLILLPCGDSAMRYIPALNIPRDVLDAGLDVLEECFRRSAS